LSDVWSLASIVWVEAMVLLGHCNIAELGRGAGTPATASPAILLIVSCYLKFIQSELLKKLVGAFPEAITNNAWILIPRIAL